MILTLMVEIEIHHNGTSSEPEIAERLGVALDVEQEEPNEFGVYKVKVLQIWPSQSSGTKH